ncbi:MAG: 4-(cytidine 5'-diphospho)-2-C-methyl-D-erythritol kinase [Candidatus Electrothrix sp. GW3-4]|uniref:4-(cytidine 5'-diphospho)-2-C-methyl-D-erythritol kinase n=1 Tax=Candidatus Electrothrix sp. GW3-4 TaxID=3126740 RepID=UPI0030CFA3A9
MEQQTPRLHLLAPAKINLSLKILGKREDGYHELESLMQKITLYDELELSLTTEPGVRIHCLNAVLPDDTNNIAVRAAQLFLKETSNQSQGVSIVLKKNIPIAAGLGGGSSDAAAVLNGLNQLLKTTYSPKQLAELGVQIGADVPLFIYDFPAALATGIGECLIPAPSLSGFQVLLVNPGILVSTKWAYEAFSTAAEKITLTAEQKAFTLPCSKKSRQKNILKGASTSEFIIPDDLLNDLEQVTVKRYPVIQDIKNRLLASGAAGAMMSGSGSTVFGLFHREAEKKAEQCRCLLQQKYDLVYLVPPLSKKEV